MNGAEGMCCKLVKARLTNKAHSMKGLGCQKCDIETNRLVMQKQTALSQKENAQVEYSI